MKKVLFTLALLLTLSMGLQAAGQKHRHSPQKELVDSANNGGVEVYSDTTSTNTAASHRNTVSITTPNSPWSSSTTTYELEDEDLGSFISNFFGSMSGKDLTGVILILGILFILFVLAPVLIIVALFYFISKNRKEKIRLAQMAVQQGQPIPDQLLEERPVDAEEEYQKGMRQCFVGVGLMIFLGYAAGNVGFGIGALVLCIGLGKVFASRTARKNSRDLYKDNFDNNDNKL